MSKPFCKLTIQDLLDILHEREMEGGFQNINSAFENLDNPMKGLISLEDAAYYLNTDQDTLEDAIHGGNLREFPEKHLIYFRSPDLIQ